MKIYNSSQHDNYQDCLSTGVSPSSVFTEVHKTQFTVFFSCVGITGTLLNSFQFYLFVRWRKLRKNGGNKLFMSMTLANSLVTSLFVIIKLLRMQYPGHCAVKKLYLFSISLLIVSSTSIAAIALIYYDRLKKFKKFHWLTRSDEPNYTKYILVCWLSPLLVISPFFLSTFFAILLLLVLLLSYNIVFMVTYNLVVKELLEHYRRARVLDMGRLDRVIVSTKFKKASELIGLLMITSFLASLPNMLSLTSKLLLTFTNEPLEQKHTSLISASGQLASVLNAALVPFVCFQKHMDVKRVCKKTLNINLFQRRNRVRPTVYHLS